MFITSKRNKMANRKLSPVLGEIGNRLKAIREKKGIELDDAAEAAEVLPEELERIEAGKTDYTIHTLLRLATFYAIELDQVFP